MVKDSLVKGTIILAAAALIARALGVVQRIPLVHLLGDEGMGSYTIAFTIYSVLLVIATAGVPSALSKLVSERTALGQHKEANRIYQASFRFAIGAGFLLTVLLFLAAPYVASFAGDPASTKAIQAIAPALLLFPLIAIMRGYFQGRQHMMPNGLSQVVEQVLRLVTAVGLAYMLLQLGYGNDWAVAGASFGGVMGSVGAIAVMLYFAWKLRLADRTALAERTALTAAPAAARVPATSTGTADTAAAGSSASAAATTESTLPYSKIYSMIFRISIPIVIFSITVPLIYFIDSLLVIPLLKEQLGGGETGYIKAKETLGILGGRAQSLAGIPIILAVALSQSIVPIISAAYARGDKEQLRAQASKTLQLAILTGLPAVIAICAAARSINIAMFENDNGTWIIIMLTISAMFQIVMQTSGAILMGLGQMKRLIVYVIVGISVKLAGSFLLAPLFGIYGIIAATFLCFVIMGQFHLHALRRMVSFTILGSKWIGLAIAAVISALLGALLEYVLHENMLIAGPRISAAVHAMAAGTFIVVLYCVLLVITRVVTADNIQAFPAPVRKLIRRFVKS